MKRLITLASATFIAPYFFLSGLGGEMADRYDKARVAQWLKFAEIAVAGIAVAGFMTASIAILFVALAGFGVIAALFGPIKYGILPDHLAREQLPAGNALVEGATFIAILTGTIAGGLASKGERRCRRLRVAGDGLRVAVLAVEPVHSADRLGRAATSHIAEYRGIHGHDAALSTRRAAAVVGRAGDELVLDRRHRRAGVLPPLVKNLIGGDEDTVTAYLAIFSVAVGAGSALAAMIARGRIVLRTTLVGAILLGAVRARSWRDRCSAPRRQSSLRGPAEIFSSLLGLRWWRSISPASRYRGGLFIVPAFAAVQAWAGTAYRARTVAAVNVLNAAFMTGATVAVALLQKAGVTVPQLFLLIGVIGLGVAAAVWRTMPRDVSVTSSAAA